MTAADDDSTLARPTLHLQRIFNAPRALLWKAWTTPEMMVRWLGPVEWPAISATCDLRVGGRWSATLQSAGGEGTLRQYGVYREIEAQERLVFTFTWDEGHEDGPAVDTLVTVKLSDRPGGRTQLDFSHAHLKSASSLIGHRHGWTSSFDRLDRWIAPRKEPY